MKKHNIEKPRNSELLSIKKNGNEACAKITHNELRAHCISVRLNNINYVHLILRKLSHCLANKRQPK